MRTYAKRSPSNEPLAIGTGDFEAVTDDDEPEFQATSVFHRDVAATQPSQRHGLVEHSGFPAHYRQVPAAPSSLAPMAMGPSRDAVATGPQRALSPLFIRSRPSATLGTGLVLAGAFVGGLLGIMMHRGLRPDDVAVASQPRETSPKSAEFGQHVEADAPIHGPASFGTHEPFGSEPEPATPTTGPAGSPAEVPSAQASVVQRDVVPREKEQKKLLPRAISTKSPVVSWQPSSAPKVSSTPVKENKNDKDDGYRIASAGNDSAPPAKDPPAKDPPAKKTERVEKAERIEKVDKREKAERADKPAKVGRRSDDAVDVLKAALGATENSF